MGKHYLYRHIRLDKNEPFYIGIGTKYKSIAEGCRVLGLNYNKTRKVYKKGHSRIKSISDLKKEQCQH